MPMSEPTLYIIDGHSQVFKAYHAIQHLSTSEGIPTNATYGFTQILHRLLRTRGPEYLVVAFDSGKPTFRHEMYAQYKANRAAPPEDLSLQFGYIVQILEAMRVPILAREGFEADDIIATVTRRACGEGFRVVIVTADKDLFQLVSDAVTVLRLDPDKETEFDRNGVKEKMGVFPEQVLDMLTMVGDTSDNIPGIAKVGPKTAVTLLEQYGTLDAIMANTASLKGKQKEYFEAGRENAALSCKLASLDHAVPIDFSFDQFKREQPDVPRLASLYKLLEFRRLLDELSVPPETRTTDYRVVADIEELRRFCDDVRTAGFVAIDTETDSLDVMVANLVGISMSVRPNEAIYVPVGHHVDFASESKQLTIDEVAAVLAPVFQDPSIRKAAHNAKFDRKILTKYGLDFAPTSCDTLLASYILNPDKRAHGLKDLARDLLGIQMTQISELIGKGQKQITFAETDIELAGPYACADADVTLQLEQLLSPRIDESEMRVLYDRIELPLIDVLIDMELTGVRIDSAYFGNLATEMAGQLAAIGSRIFVEVGHQFNLASPRQVAQVLFEELKLSPGKQKKSGPSTDIQVLEELAAVHPVPRMIVEYRQLEKLKSTYVDVLPGLVCRGTGRIHTTYNQWIAATGRLSSSDPNLQNIPVRTELGRRIRQGFIPLSRDSVLLSADYSQVELRVLAHVARDPGLTNAYQTGLDVHMMTAAKVFRVAEQEVTHEMRDHAKMINFGIIYGMSAQGLSTRLKIPFADAKRFIDEYFRVYEGVRKWIDETLEHARQKGFVATISGRRRYLADINSKNFNARSAAERYAINAPIQGTSADMIKIAMIRMHRWLKDSDLRTRMIMQVHDELIFDVPREELAEVEPRVKQIMEEALPLDVPVKVDTATGANWAEC